MDFCPECGSMIIKGTKCPMCDFDSKNFYFKKLVIVPADNYISDKSSFKKNYGKLLNLIANKNEIEFTQDDIITNSDNIIDAANEAFINTEKKFILKEFNEELNSLNNFIDETQCGDYKDKYNKTYFPYYDKLDFKSRIDKYNDDYIKKESYIISEDFDKILASKSNYIFKSDELSFHKKYKKEYCDYYVKLKMEEKIKEFNEKYGKQMILDTLPNEYISYSRMKDYQEKNNIPFDMYSIIEEHNNLFIENQIKLETEFFDNITNRSLDTNQKIAVLTDDDNTQIVAGAGTGKTLTLQAKVKYLIEKQGINPKDILCISFSKSASMDLARKLKQTLGNKPVDVRTFHSLGYSILGINGYDKEVPDNELSQFVEMYLEQSISENPKLIKEFIEFFCYYFNVIHINNENLKLETIKSRLNSLDEYDEYLSEYLQIENVRKKHEYMANVNELILANYLFIHKIKYAHLKQAIFKDYNYDKYVDVLTNYLYDGEISKFIPYDVKLESVKKFDEELGDKKDCYPTFFLPDFDIYIDLLPFKNNWGKVLKYKERENVSKILENREKLNKKYKTKILSIFDYGDDIESLLEVIDEKLSKFQIKMDDSDYDFLFKNLILKNELPEFKIFIKTVESFINLFKGNGDNIDEDGNDISDEKFDLFIKQNSEKNCNSLEKRNEFYLEIIREIYVLYSKFLEEKFIDFNDMINKAIIALRKGANIHKYKYLIVDEFQDTSHTRYRLLKEVQNVTGAKVVVVGDDWQSIYGFTGCDVNLFSQFDKYFEHPKRIKIDITHRNCQKLINIVGEFIQKNKNQIPKELKSDYVTNKFPIKIYEYVSRAYEVLALLNILDDISKQKKDASVLILGRNNKDIYEISCKKIFETIQFADYTVIEYERNPDLNIEFRTVHKSKGLEADYVIVLNLNDQIDGFPNKIVNDPILNFVNNTQNEDIEYAEERRLFYVALTRTRNDVYLFNKVKRPSQFITEISEKEGVEYLKYTFSNEDVIFINNLLDKKFEVVETGNKCPICKSGQVNLIVNNERGTSYFRCSNFCGWEGAKYHNNKYDDGTRKIEYVQFAKVCNDCKGMLIVRKNSNDGSHFLGCTSYPKCRNTVNRIIGFEKLDDIELNIVDNLKGINISRTGVYYMNDYVPEKKRKYYDLDRVNFSKRLIGYKNDKDGYSVDLFTRDLMKFISLISKNKLSKFSKVALITVPSSKVEKVNNSMKKSVDIIEGWFNKGELETNFDFAKEIINYNNLLKRVKDVPTAHIGEGRANCQQHIDSIQCMESKLSDDENIVYIVLDDITTTGESMKACNQILFKKGINPKNIYNIAIGATVWDENEEI